MVWAWWETIIMLHTPVVWCNNYAINSTALCYVYDSALFELGWLIVAGRQAGFKRSLCERTSLTAFVLADGCVPRSSPTTRKTILRLNHNKGLTLCLSVLSKSYTNREDLQIGEQMQRSLKKTEICSSCALWIAEKKVKLEKTMALFLQS